MVKEQLLSSTTLCPQVGQGGSSLPSLPRPSFHGVFAQAAGWKMIQRLEKHPQVPGCMAGGWPEPGPAGVARREPGC